MVISSIGRLKASLPSLSITQLNSFLLPITRLKRGLIIILTLAVSAAIGGCSWIQFPGVYRLSIQQGNIVTQEMVDQLQPGMTKRQVNFVLGSPLIKDSFNQDRWDYFYSLRDPHGNSRKERLTVYFENDQLASITGDYQPANTNSTDPVVEAAARDLEKSAAEVDSPVEDAPEPDKVPGPENAPTPEELEETQPQPGTINPEPSIDGSPATDPTI